MPGRFRQLWAYDAFGGGADVYMSDAWDERGTWYKVYWTPVKRDDVLFGKSYHVLGWPFSPLAMT